MDHMTNPDNNPVKQEALRFENDLFAPHYQRRGSSAFWRRISVGTRLVGLKPFKQHRQPRTTTQRLSDAGAAMALVS
jgi:hypothetical protein